MPARTYSFIEPALGIIVASSEKLSACMYIASRPIANATRKIQLAAIPCPTETRTVVATMRPNTVLIAVGSPTARRSSRCGCACASKESPLSQWRPRGQTPRDHFVHIIRSPDKKCELLLSYCGIASHMAIRASIPIRAAHMAGLRSPQLLADAAVPRLARGLGRDERPDPAELVPAEA